MRNDALAARVRAEHGDRLRDRARHLCAAVERRDPPDALASEVHALRGAVLTCGIDSAASALAALENALTADEIDAASLGPHARLAQLEIEEALRTDSVATVLHDARSALNVALGYAELQKGSDVDAKQRQWADAIATAAMRAAQHLERLESLLGADTPPRDPTPAVASPRPADGQRFRVLVIEDDAPTAQLVEMALSAEDGVDVVVEGNAADGVDAARSWSPDLVLLDGRLPDADGAETLSRLRAAVGGTPVLVLTADTSADFAAALEALGAHAILIKPLSPAELVSAVAAVRW